MATTTKANNRNETTAQLHHPIPSSITTTTATTTDTTSIHTPGDYDLMVKEESTKPSSSELWERLQGEAQQVLEAEPELQFLLQATILDATHVQSFEDAIARTVAYRLLQGGASNGGTLSFCDPLALCSIFKSVLRDHADSICRQIQADVLAVVDRDPACDTLLEVILFMKGFAALVTHRIAHAKWISTNNTKQKSYLALWLQSQASVMFGVDIHPGATMGSGILLDHGTGIVIGETAVVGDNCTILHGVTLGGTGKDHGDRHPKIGNNVLIGAGTQVLGNIRIGNAAKIGAGSVVLRPIPPGATAVGAPAKIIGRALDTNPAQNPDSNLDQVGLLHKSASDGTFTTTTAATTLSSSTRKEEKDDDDEVEEEGAASSGEEIDDDPDLDDVLRTDGKDPTLQSKESKERRHSSSIVLAKTTRTAAATVDRSPPPGCVCPYREYTKMALTAPSHAITILNLAQVFMSVDPQATTTDQVGCTFFELDLENVGHVYWPKDNAVDDDESNASRKFEKRLAKALQNNTSLTSDHQQQIIEKLRRRFAGKTTKPHRGGTTTSGS